ncbi:hypothetical protein [Nostoc sp.]|uniref:hypothetical protein n=1 Tax=Nostoc sp. TaxID=1180 RepID=UPI002FFBC347
MTQTSSLVRNPFREITVNHPLWNHEFLTRCRAGNLFLPDIQVLAVQMYKFSKEFNRILASILSCCQDESSQLVILENLFDEMGQGDITQSHPELSGLTQKFILPKAKVEMMGLNMMNF